MAIMAELSLEAIIAMDQLTLYDQILGLTAPWKTNSVELHDSDLAPLLKSPYLTTPKKAAGPPPAAF
ncbi:MAG: hypothetical protein COB09_00830 [Thalassobium sp.]|nr:MAG: hypothetical protein COB09_00830 [Thalassobium sp.]